MSLSELFTFVSPEEKRRRDRDFVEKIFPLGLEQRELALQALRPLIRPKISDEILLYAFIAAKEKYLDDFEQKAAVACLQKQPFFSDTEKSYVAALILLDVKVKSKAEYPCADDVKEAALALLTQR